MKDKERDALQATIDTMRLLEERRYDQLKRIVNASDKTFLSVQQLMDDLYVAVTGALCNYDTAIDDTGKVHTSLSVQLFIEEHMRDVYKELTGVEYVEPSERHRKSRRKK